MQTVYTMAYGERNCRSMHGLHDTVEEFSLHAYGMCYKYLFFQKPITLYRDYDPILIVDMAQGVFLQLSQDYKNMTSREQVCSTLSRDQCRQWISCCQAADACCNRQRSFPVGSNSSCPMIWDGWSCFDNAPPSSTNYQNCPVLLAVCFPN